MSTVIENAELLRTENHQAFLNAARRVGMGESVSAEEIEAVSTKAGKTIKQFEWMADSFTHRATIRRRIAELSGSEAEYREVQEQIRAANEELELAASHHQRVTGPLQRRIHELRAAIAEFHNLPTGLLQTCPAPELHERLRGLGRRREANNVRDQQLRERIDDVHRAMSRAESDIERLSIRDSLKSLESQLAEVEAIEKDLKHQADECVQAMKDF